jgi:hypothetical protein
LGAVTLVLIGAVAALMLAAVLLSVGGLMVSVMMTPVVPMTELAEDKPTRPSRSVVLERPEVGGAGQVEEASVVPQPEPATTADQQIPAPVPAPAPAPAPAVLQPLPNTPPVPSASSSLTVRLLSSPRTVLLDVDGIDRARTPAKLELSPGVHRIAMTLGEGESAQRRTFLISAEEGADNKWCYSFPDSVPHKGSCPR